MNKLALTLFAFTFFGIQACTTTVEKSRRVTEQQAAPASLQFVWSAAKPPAFGNLPALGATPAAMPTTGAFANYPAEHAAFGAALKQALPAQPLVLGKASLTELPTGHTAQQLAAITNQADRQAALVVMYPEQVTSYCLPGCYAFKVRVNYLAPNSRKLVWTGVIDSPPKSKHSDRFDTLANGFAKVLVQQLQREQLLPP